MSNLKPLSQSRIERNGVKTGTLAPEFVLDDIYGRRVSLSEYRGRRVLLVFSDPHCGPCNELAPHLVRAYAQRRSTTAIIVVGRGELKENRQKADEHGFEFSVVVQDRWKLSRRYGIFATPVAFLIGEDGRTLRPVARGAHQIRALLREEFSPGIAGSFSETFGGISRAFSSPIPRRRAFRIAGAMFAGLVLSALGARRAAAAVLCQAGETVCGLECCTALEGCCNGTCCEQGWHCCGVDCCPADLACCGGTCCAPTEVCTNGKCQQPILP